MLEHRPSALHQINAESAGKTDQIFWQHCGLRSWCAATLFCSRKIRPNFRHAAIAGFCVCNGGGGRAGAGDFSDVHRRALSQSGGGLHLWNTSSIVHEVQSPSELVTVKYVMEKVVVLGDVKWYGESRVLLLSHGIAKAGIDLKKLSPGDVSISGKKFPGACRRRRSPTPTSTTRRPGD